MAKVVIEAGHGLYTAGKRCLKSLDSSETREWVLNSRVVNKVIQHVQNHNVQVLRTDDPTGQADVTLIARCNKANEYKADLFISVHHNTGIEGGNGGGIISFMYSGRTNDIDKKLRDNIYDCAVAETGLIGNRSTPKATANFQILRGTKMPACLIECGFMDSPTDIKYILTNDYAEKVALGIAKGILRTLGIDFKGDTPAQDVPTEQPSGNYYQKCSDGYASIVDALKSIGVDNSYENRERIASVNGITGYEGNSSQNIKMLELLKAGSLKKVDTVSNQTPSIQNVYPACRNTFTSIADALISVGVSGNYETRQRIASANGISGYVGSYEQNIKMLDLLKSGALKKA